VLDALPPAVARAIDRAVDGRAGPILRNTHNARMNRHAVSRRPVILEVGGRHLLPADGASYAADACAAMSVHAVVEAGGVVGQLGARTRCDRS
jgi:hypothetical protein